MINWENWWLSSATQHTTWFLCTSSCFYIALYRVLMNRRISKTVITVWGAQKVDKNGWIALLDPQWVTWWHQLEDQLYPGRILECKSSFIDNHSIVKSFLEGINLFTVTNPPRTGCEAGVVVLSLVTVGLFAGQNQLFVSHRDDEAINSTCPSDIRLSQWVWSDLRADLKNLSQIQLIRTVRCQSCSTGNIFKVNTDAVNLFLSGQGEK